MGAPLRPTGSHFGWFLGPAVRGVSRDWQHEARGLITRSDDGYVLHAAGPCGEVVIYNRFKVALLRRFLPQCEVLSGSRFIVNRRNARPAMFQVHAKVANRRGA